MNPLSAVFNSVVLVLLALGVTDVFFSYESSRCSMTYMFEYPQYLQIKLSKKVSRLYPLYELYLYGEGSYAEENKNLTLTGVPVLFLPGNAGSYKQARSFASVALRKAENIGNRYHFNIFTVNFNEELVALYGGSLRRQTRFVHECIKTILSLYKNQTFPPESVAIIGHSMGGLVARALFTLKHFKPDLINVIITQATPHILPVLSTDIYLTDFYTMVNNYWIYNSLKLRNITMLSVAGGYSDYQVRSGLTFLPTSSFHTSALSVVSSAVPITWASTDHLSIVWCRELVLVTARALFDLIDEHTKQINIDPQSRMSVIKHHFVRHPAKHLESRHQITASFTETPKFTLVEDSKWTYTVNKESNESFFLFPLLDKRIAYSHFHCQNTFLYTHSWIFGCNKTVSPKCLQINDLSWETELLPSAKVVNLKLDVYSNLSHFILYIPATNGSKFSVECEFLSEEARTVHVPVTHVLSFGFSSSHAPLNSSGLLYVIQFEDFSKIYQAFNVFIVRNCGQNKESKSSIYKFHVPWSHEDLIGVLSDELPVRISAKLHAEQPQNDNRLVKLFLYASPECLHEVTISTSFSQILGQIVRFHGIYLPVYIVANLLLAYGAQLHSILIQGSCMDLDLSFDVAAKPYKVDPVLIICKYLLNYKWFKNYWDGLMLPQLDAVQLHAYGFWFPLASLFFFIFGTSIAYWSSIGLQAAVRILSSLWIYLKRPSMFPKESKCITYRVYAETLFFAFISWRSCGTFSLLLVFLRYLSKVLILYSSMKNYVSLNAHIVKDTSSKQDSVKTDSDTNINSNQLTHHQPSSLEIKALDDCLKMHFTILHLNLWIVLLGLPSFIYWLKTLRYTIQLDPDPNRVSALVLIFILEILMNSTTSAIKSSVCLKTAAVLQLPLSIIVVAFGTLHLYRISNLIAFSLFLHVVCCFV
ncbi:GPI inositol-deacylase precursor [Xenopus laevis]|uniref:GPI inositol-deacylase n=1 Tax=Xenopus laevis TaxID=8355 RepID=PGAP1_XENLA|nr:GPI inositol-deacylase [Xenopus laevis]Q66J01.1 RecName: Full=GPI inositol-deacylase; AltName: Full=Post-GPI attachment to proteins factor 1 [Xenopus laevis]AAH81123.1 MGC83827 protein [Xenopus laevis]